MDEMGEEGGAAQHPMGRLKHPDACPRCNGRRVSHEATSSSEFGRSTYACGTVLTEFSDQVGSGCVPPFWIRLQNANRLVEGIRQRVDEICVVSQCITQLRAKRASDDVVEPLVKDLEERIARLLGGANV